MENPVEHPFPFVCLRSIAGVSVLLSVALLAGCTKCDSTRAEVPRAAALSTPVAAPSAKPAEAPSCGPVEGEDDDAQIRRVITCFKFAFEQGNTASLAKITSKEFKGHDGMTYEWFLGHQREILDMAKAVKATVNLEGAKILIKGNEALFGPSEVKTTVGAFLFRFKLDKGEDGWKITEMQWTQK